VVAKAATVEVTPEQAQKLALAAQVGTLTLALRGAIDPLELQSPGASRTVRTADLRLEGVAIPLPVRPRPAPARRVIPAAGPTIEIFRGGQSTKVAAPREPSFG
jgi:pilus assembly protein CpaB